MTDEEIALELLGLIRWEPGMMDTGADRVNGVGSDGRLDLVDRDDYGDIVWREPDAMWGPDLDDDSTVAVLLDQLRRRFAAVGWGSWTQGVSAGDVGTVTLVAAEVPDLWHATGPTGECLLEGFRKVVELEAADTGHGNGGGDGD